jgi:hypothetical protein
MPHPKSTTTFSTILAIPVLTLSVASLNAQSGASGVASGGLGTAGGAAASRSQIGVTSPPGVVLPNANGTGLGTSQPSYLRAYEGLNRNTAPGSFQAPRRGAATTGTVPQRTRCPTTVASTGTTTTSTGTRTAALPGATTTSSGTGATVPTGATTTSGGTDTTGSIGTATTPLVSGAAQALAASTGSRPAGLTPVISGAGSVSGNCGP